jgi:hypothetical protein
MWDLESGARQVALIPALRGATEHVETRGCREGDLGEQHVRPHYLERRLMAALTSFTILIALLLL